MCVVDGFFVGFYCDKVYEVVFDQFFGVFFDGGDVEVFGFGVEEGYGGGVDIIWEWFLWGGVVIGGIIGGSYG